MNRRHPSYSVHKVTYVHYNKYVHIIICTYNTVYMYYMYTVYNILLYVMYADMYTYVYTYNHIRLKYVLYCTYCI